MANRSRTQKNARRLQAVTGWPYQRCLNALRGHSWDAQAGIIVLHQLAETGRETAEGEPVVVSVAGHSTMEVNPRTAADDLREWSREVNA